jgi:hypothetical protein
MKALISLNDGADNRFRMCQTIILTMQIVKNNCMTMKMVWKHTRFNFVIVFCTDQRKTTDLVHVGSLQVLICGNLVGHVLTLSYMTDSDSVSMQ